MTLNGILLAEGIPTTSRFGGLLELHRGKPVRFVAIINYDGTSLDPLEIFIKSGMTDYTGATENGDGLIGAGFREMPAASRDRLLELAEELKQVGLGGFMNIGWPGQPLVGIPVNEGIVGAVVIGGLNPVAILEEHGIRVHSRALSGFVDYRPPLRLPGNGEARRAAASRLGLKRQYCRKIPPDSFAWPRQRPPLCGEPAHPRAARRPRLAAPAAMSEHYGSLSPRARSPAGGGETPFDACGPAC